MAEFKLVISDSKGQAVQREIKDEQADAFINKIIGDKVSGDAAGMPGYEFQITGGSDKAGFPMRRDVIGRIRARILATDSIGVHIEREGMKKRKTVAGNMVHEGISQINLKVVKQGKEPLFQKAPAEAKPEEKAEKKEEKKEQAQEEKKQKEEKQEKKEAKPKAKKNKESEKPTEKQG
jgi:small subunit ribosomal protein S6e